MVYSEAGVATCQSCYVIVLFKIMNISCKLYILFFGRSKSLIMPSVVSVRNMQDSIHFSNKNDATTQIAAMSDSCSLIFTD